MMIKVNLTEKKKKFTAPVVLGVDLSRVSIRKIVFAIVLTQVPLFFFDFYADQQLSQSTQQTLNLREVEGKLRKEVRKNKKVAQQLDSFNEQIKDLKKRGEQVKQILRSRTNPRYVLEKVARLMPEKLWLDKLIINNEKKVIFSGGSEDYRSIGSFIKELNDTAYFNKNLQLKVSKTETELINKREYRYESFIVEGSVESFNPFLEGGE